MTAPATTGCPNECAPAFLEGFGPSLRCRRCGWTPSTIQPTTKRCPRCEVEIPLTARSHECGWAGTANSFGPTGPSQLRAERNPATERELARERAAFDREVEALHTALTQAEQSLRNAKLRAATVGQLEGALTGRQPESGRDQILAPVRGRVIRSLRAIEALL